MQNDSKTRWKKYQKGIYFMHVWQSKTGVPDQQDRYSPSPNRHQGSRQKEPLKSSTCSYQDHDSHLNSGHPGGRKSMEKHEQDSVLGQIWKSRGHMLLLLKLMVAFRCIGDLTCTVALCSGRENGLWWAAFSHSQPWAEISKCERMHRRLCWGRGVYGQTGKKVGIW